MSETSTATNGVAVSAAAVPSNNWPLPTEPEEAYLVDPRFFLLYSKVKAGKTIALSLLKNCLIMDLEDHGIGFHKALGVQIIGLYPPPKAVFAEDGKILLNVERVKVKKDAAGKVSYDFSDCIPCRWNIGETKSMRDNRQRIDKKFYLYEVLELVSDPNAPHKYTYGAVDSVSKLDEWAEIEGTYLFMSMSQGKNWNRIKPGDSNSEWIHHTDPRWESIHTMGEGHGYRYSRMVMSKVKDDLCRAFPSFIAVCHERFNKVTNKRTGEETHLRDIALTGQVRDIWTRQADAIGYLYQNEKKTFVSFLQGDESKDGANGSRCPRLTGQTIHLYTVEQTDQGMKPVESFWNRIYTKTPV